MDWLKLFRGERKNTAQTAKERLMIAVAHQRLGDSAGFHFLPQMREELLDVVRRYIQVPDDSVQCTVQRDDGIEILELNITLPEDAKTPPPPHPPRPTPARTEPQRKHAQNHRASAKSHNHGKR